MESPVDISSPIHQYRMISRLWFTTVSLFASVVWLNNPSMFSRNSWMVLSAGALLFILMFVPIAARLRYPDLSDDDFDRLDIRDLNFRPSITHPAATTRRATVRLSAAVLWICVVRYFPTRLGTSWTGGVLFSLAASGLLALRGLPRSIPRTRTHRLHRRITRHRSLLGLLLSIGCLTALGTLANTRVRFVALLASLAVVGLARRLIANSRRFH